MVTPPIDHGWAWVCVLGCNMVNFFVVGGFKSLGIFLVEFSETFNSNSYLTSWVAGIISLFMSVLAPFSNAFAALYTNRAVVMCGGVVMAMGAICSVFADSILSVVLVYGIITGAGFGLSYSPSIVVVSQYFNKRRSLANGIAVSGASIGQFAIPPLLRYLVDTYSLRGALLIYGGLTLNVVVCGALFRPFSFYTNRKKTQNTEVASAAEEIVLTKESHVIDGEFSPDEQLIKDAHRNGGSFKDQVASHNQDCEISAVVDEKTRNSLYTSTGSLYLASMQSIPQNVDTKRSQMDGFMSCCPWNKSGIRLFNFALLKNYLFVIYLFGICFGNIGYVNPLLLIPKHAEDIGINKHTAAILLSISGISDFVGRVSGGWFSDLNLIRRSRLMSICLGLTGTVCIVCSFFDSFASLVIFSVVMGAVGGSYISLMAVVLVDFVGLEKLPQAFGLTIMFMGASNLPIPSLLGMVRDSFGRCNAAFQICGVLMLLGSLSFSLESCATKLQNRNRERDKSLQEEQAAELSV